MSEPSIYFNQVDGELTVTVTADSVAELKGCVNKVNRRMKNSLYKRIIRWSDMETISGGLLMRHAVFRLRGDSQ